MVSKIREVLNGSLKSILILVPLFLTSGWAAYAHLDNSKASKVQVDLLSCQVRDIKEDLREDMKDLSHKMDRMIEMIHIDKGGK